MTAPLATRIREKLRTFVQAIHRQYYIRVWRMEIGEGSVVSLSAKLDKTNPCGVHIGKYSVVSFGAAILAHDWVNDIDRDIFIGDNCFIGAHSMILPGVTIGDNCIVSAGSIVVRSIPAGSLVTGNPARVVESNVKTTHWGVRVREKTAQEANNQREKKHIVDQDNHPIGNPTDCRSGR